MVAQEATNNPNTSGIKRFVREVKAELKKVSWPTKQELLSHTGVVFVTVVVASTLIWAVDAIFNQVLRFIIK